MPLTPAERIEVIAAAVHQAWYAYSVLALGEEGSCWEDALDYQKKGLYHTIRFWESFEPQNLDPEYLAKASHLVWAQDKMRDGWVYGSVKDPVAKTHPCLRPYDELKSEDQRKDLVIVRAYLTMRRVLGEP